MNLRNKILKIFKSKYFILSTIILIAAMTVSVYSWDMKRLGKSPSGARLERIKKSNNYKNGEFVNQSPTSIMPVNSSNFFSMMYKFFFEPKGDRVPSEPIPSVKTSIKNIPLNEDVLVWFGHSSYFIQIDGKRFLIDPVFSTYAAPFSFVNKAFDGTTVYYPSDLPEIDYLVITHDHWDHLDYATVKAYKGKVKGIICPLGVGEHFEYWDFDTTKIIEGDWYESFNLGDNFKISFFPQRHFSGRTFSRNQTLWTSYVLTTPSMKIFMGGDGGYDKHFAEIGNIANGVDLAILENGQYNEQWKAIHSLPDQTVQAAIDLKAKRFLPVHNSKFLLAFHPWKEPLDSVTKLAAAKNLNVATPMLGEILKLKDPDQKFDKWWEKVK